jgi:hypothetical protein
MSTSDLQPSAIDEKKQSNIPLPTNAPGSLLLKLSGQLVYLFITIFVGGILLYSSKVAQSNIIPTDFDCEPYTDNKSIEQVLTDIDVVKDGIFTYKTVTTNKLYFPYEENIEIIKNSLFGVGYLKEWYSGKNTNPYKIYFASIQLDAFSNYSSMMNSVYNSINQNCSESVIVFLIPYIFILIVIFISIINWAYILFLWFYNLYLLFSTKNPQTNKWSYTPGDSTKFKNWLWLFFYIWAACLLFFPIGIMFIIPLLLSKNVLSVLLLPLLMIGKVKKLNSTDDNSIKDDKYTFIGAFSKS